MTFAAIQQGKQKPPGNRAILELIQWFGGRSPGGYHRRRRHARWRREPCGAKLSSQDPPAAPQAQAGIVKLKKMLAFF